MLYSVDQLSRICHEQSFDEELSLYGSTPTRHIWPNSSFEDVSLQAIYRTGTEPKQRNKIEYAAETHKKHEKNLP